MHVVIPILDGCILYMDIVVNANLSSFYSCDEDVEVVEEEETASSTSCYKPRRPIAHSSLL